MIIQDRIYGAIEITNPLLIDLINSKPFQRLKKISQDGAAHFIQPHRNVTRFEHCIGAWYLSSRYNRPLEEQIASLLHDLPHTAFSHVIDNVVEDKNHEYHDRFLEKVILDSEIPQILEKHQTSLDKILAKESFPLLNNNLPDISVDRWDYFMRDGYSGNLIPKETIALFLNNIKEKDEKFYFTDIRVASLFSILFMNCSRLLWLDPSSHGSFFLLAEAIKTALKKEYITEQDFFTNDDILMEKLRQTNDPEITTYLERLKPNKEFHYAPKDQAEFYGFNKTRSVNPWVLQDNKLQQLSSLVPGLQEYFAEFKANYSYLGVNQS